MSKQSVANKVPTVVPSLTWRRNALDRPKVEAMLSTIGTLQRKRERLSIAEELSHIEGAITADRLAKILCVSKITIFKMAKAGRIPSFRVGTCVRFDPRKVVGFEKCNTEASVGMWTGPRVSSCIGHKTPSVGSAFITQQ
jgi:excisionase family DNA binding protein